MVTGKFDHLVVEPVGDLTYQLLAWTTSTEQLSDQSERQCDHADDSADDGVDCATGAAGGFWHGKTSLP